MNNKIITGILLVAGLMLMAAMAGAQVCSPPDRDIRIWGTPDARPKVAAANNPGQVTIGIGRYEMFEIKAPASGYSVAEREVIIYNRLIEILSTGPVAPERVCIYQVRSAPTIYVGPYRFVSVYASDAKAVGTSQLALAEKWRQGIAQALPNVATAAFARRGSVPFATPCLSGASAVRPGEYPVAFGGQLLLRLRTAGSYSCVEARGQAVESQIVKVLSLRSDADTRAVAQPAGAQWAVQWGDLTLVEVSAADAAANGNDSMASLARQWAARLNQILPELTTPGAVDGEAPAESDAG